MSNDRRLTRLDGEPGINEHIVDAEYVEIDEEPARSSAFERHRRLTASERFDRHPWYIRIAFFLVLGLFAAAVMGAVFGAASPDSATPQPESSAFPDTEASANEQTDQSEAPPPPPQGLIAEGNCHMGECSWSDITRKIVSQKSDGSRLVTLNILGGTSRDTGSKSEDRKMITWNSDQHQVYVYCSLNLPAVMMNVDGKWQVDILDFTNGIPDILSDSADLYSYACHGKLSAWSRPDFAKRFGYETPIYDSITIEKPEDILSM
ncbi:MAG: hypothetical protein KGJ57_20320 [Sphingomonadales bacterium]|nr:hypothetical protein [Sphingomonadales bacterium]